MDQHGLCEDMCPEKEIKFRVKQRLVHELEKTSNGQPDVLVKEYRRSAAGRDTSDVRQLRTIGALVRTTDYLINEVCGLDKDWAVIYEFVFDRLRAIRQDMVIQSMNDGNTVYILEQCVRFYLISIDKLKGRPINVFDTKINDTHIQEVLKQLLVLYDTTLSACVTTKTIIGDDSAIHKNRKEFESIYILFNMNHQDALNHFLSLPSALRGVEPCKKVWQLNMAVYHRNYVRVFKLVEDLPELLYCALYRHIPSLQLEMLRRMNTAYSSKACKYPLSHLCTLIGQKHSEDVTSLLEAHGVPVIDGHIKFSKAAWKS